MQVGSVVKRGSGLELVSLSGAVRVEDSAAIKLGENRPKLVNPESSRIVESPLEVIQQRF
jgi:hypothetical protein